MRVVIVFYLLNYDVLSKGYITGLAIEARLQSRYSYHLHAERMIRSSATLHYKVALSICGSYIGITHRNRLYTTQKHLRPTVRILKPIPAS